MRHLIMICFGTLLFGTALYTLTDYGASAFVLAFIGSVIGQVMHMSIDSNES